MTLGKYLVILAVCSLSLHVEAQFACSEITSEAGIDHHYLGTTYLGGGAAFFDMDNDGDEDIWVTGGMNMDALYQNNGDGTFTDIGMEANIWVTNSFVTTGVVTGDVNNDGFRDVLVLTHNGHRLLLFINNGNHTFSEESIFWKIGNVTGQSYAAAFADINLDGHLDIYVGNYIENGQAIYDGNTVIGFDHDCLENWFFLNNGDGTFSEKAASFGLADEGCALAVAFTDFDLDADPDLLLANDFGEWVTPNGLFQNEFPIDTLLDVGAITGMNVGLYGMGIAVGDYDHDSDLDYFVTNLGRNVFMENQNDGSFLDKATETGTDDIYMDSLLATGWGTAFMDVDNDTDLDLFVCNGYIPAADFIANDEINRNRLFINNGNETNDGFRFTDAAFGTPLQDGGRGRGFAYSDFDNDGDLDFLIINNNKQATADSIQQILLFRNDLENENNWLKVKLAGTLSNRDGYGSTLKIMVGDKKWVHDYNGGFGTHASQNSSIAHFGLGNAEVVDSLVVTWPGGEKRHFSNIAANQLLHIMEGENLVDSSEEPEPGKVKLQTFPNPFTEELHIQFHVGQAEKVIIELVDPLGKKIQTISDEWFAPGNHQVLWQTENSWTPKGWFVLRFKTEKQLITQRVIRIH